MQQEINDLRRKASEAERIATAATDRTKHPAAKDAVQRHGDWMCFPCGFKANRHYRGFCYRCAEPRSASCGPASPTTADAAGAQGTPGTAVAMDTTPTAPPISSAEAAKSIKQRIASLESAKSALAASHGCEAEKLRIEQGINAAREELAVHLPVEVAVKTTLAPVQQARAAVAKAETKVAKLESQLASLVEQHTAASTELEASRSKLAEAEAATAKAASAALPAQHYLSAVASDPGPFWAAFKTVILQRCPNVSRDAWGHLDAATRAFEAALTPVFSQPAAAAAPTQLAGTTAAQCTGRPLSNPLPPALAPRGQMPVREVSVDGAALPGAADPTAAALAAAGPGMPLVNVQPTSADGAIEAMVQAMAGPPSHEQQPSPPPAASAAAAAAAASDVSRALQAASAAAAATTLSDDTNSIPGNVEQARSGGADGDGGLPNDPMGGGASDAITNKRSFEALRSAREIVAKAKAKAAA